MSSEEKRVSEETAEEVIETDDAGTNDQEIDKAPQEPDMSKEAEDEEIIEDEPIESPGDSESSSSGEPGRKSFFGKKKDKKDPKDTKIEELTDRLQRSMAEFDNYRKRTEKEKTTMFEIGAKDIIEKILPVVDNFERGLATISEEDKGTPFAEGMDKIYRQLMKTLEDTGVKPIEAVGQPFDPSFHNAVMHIEDENFGENIVAMELMKGYTYRESVVRHSMVQVAN